MVEKEITMFTKRMLATALVAAFTVLTGAFSQQASADVVRAVEYDHPGIDHLFVTANSQEIDALDSGTVGGWLRTGQRFRVDDAPAPGLVPVCRFYTSAYGGKATHFFTASASECDGLKAASDWVYEGVAFYARLPDAAGSCGAGTVAIHRLYNGGQGGAPNHAYTAYDETQKVPAQSGWVPEGVAFCAPLAAGNPIVNTQALAGSEWNLPRELPTDDARPTNQIRFQSTVRLVESSNAPEPVAYVPFQARGDGFAYGSGTWDPIAGSYSVMVGDVVGLGEEVTFDDATGPNVPVCTMHKVAGALDWNPSVAQRYPVELFTGCEPGLAHRLSPGIPVD